MIKKKGTYAGFPIGFLVLVILIMFIIYRYSNMQQNEAQIKTLPPSEYEQLTAMDLKVRYPDGPQTLIDLNNRFIQYLYGGEINEDEINGIIEKQRGLFAPELLDLNEVTQSVRIAAAQISQMAASGKKIMEIRSDLPVYAESEKTGEYESCTITVTQYWTNNVQDILEYTLVNSGGKWMIFRFDRVGSKSGGD